MYRTFVELRPESARPTRGATAAPLSTEVRVLFQDHVAVHPCQRLKLETDPHEIEMRVVDLFTPIAKGRVAVQGFRQRSGRFPGTDS